MLCLSGFELYSRWVPLIKGSAQLIHFSPAEHKLYRAVSCPLHRSYIVVQILTCKIPERVILSGAICKRLSKVSRR